MININKLYFRGNHFDYDGPLILGREILIPFRLRAKTTDKCLIGGENVILDITMTMILHFK